MNYRLVVKYLGVFAGAMAVLYTPSMLWAVWFREWDALFGLFGAAAICLVAGAALYLAGRRASDTIFQREALALVAFAWFVASLFGSLPYICTGSMSVADAIFESSSGFTTTGASILGDIPALPKSILFWRCFTHWVGGMGIIVLFIAVLPYLGAGGKQLFRSETTGPTPSGLRPRIKESATLLYRIYIGLTALQTILLMVVGRMDFFDALAHTMSTLATGGFSTRNASIGHYDSVAIEAIIILFMIIAGTNFSLFFAMTKGNWKAIFQDTEWRVYISIISVATILLMLNLVLPFGRETNPLFSEVSGEQLQQPEYSWGHAFREAAFQATSIATGTGFATEDYNQYPHFSRMLLVILMFTGGCAGSTAGGLKVIRAVVLVKMALQRIESTFRPKTVRALRVNGHIIDEDVQQMVSAFFIVSIMWVTVGSAIIAAFGIPIISSVTAVISCLCNVGPGLEYVGPVENYGSMPAFCKLFLSLCMIGGRLEILTVTVLFVPSFWRVGR